MHLGHSAIFFKILISSYSQNLILLSNNTNNVVEYAEQNINKNKKDYNFWNLINNND